MSQPTLTAQVKGLGRLLLVAGYLLLLIALIAVLLLLGTHRGNQAVLSLLPRLEPRLSLTLDQGLLLGDASISQLRWTSPGAEIDIPRVDWSWDWQCLWAGNLCLDRLQSQGAKISLSELPPPADTASEEESTDTFALPFGIQLRDLQLEQTQINLPGLQIALNQLQLAARLDQDGLTVSALELQDLQIALPPEPAAVPSSGAGSASVPDQPAQPPEIHLPFPIRLEGLLLQNGRITQAGTLFTVERLQLSADATQPAAAGREAGVDSAYTIQLRDLQLDRAKLDYQGQKVALQRLQMAASFNPDGLTVSPLKLQDLQIVLAAEPGAAQPVELPAAGVRKPAVRLPEIYLPFPIKLEGLLLEKGRFEKAGQHVVLERLQLAARAQQAEVELQQLRLELPQVALRAQGKIVLHKNYPLNLKVETTKLALPPFTNLGVNFLGQGSLADLKLELKSVGELRSQLTGRVNLLDPLLPFSAQLDWQQLGWPLQQPQFRSERGQLTIQGSSEAYRFELTASGSGEQLPSLQVTAAGQGDRQQLNFSPLAIDVYEGQIAATGTLKFATGLSWLGQLTLSDINPAALRADLPGKLSGSLRSAFSLDAEQWSLQLQDIKLAGVLADRPLKLQGQVAGNQAGEWLVSGLELYSGENRLSVAGQIGAQADLQGTLEIVDLQQSVLQAAGRLSGKFALSGPKKSPLLIFSLAGQQLVLGEERIEHLEADGQLQISADPQGTINIHLEDSRYQGHSVELVELQLNGDLQSHRLAVEISGDELSLQSSIQGQLVERLWSGQLQNSWAQTPLGRWQLDAPVPLSAALDQRQLEIARHCWLSGDASLCLTEDASVGAEGDVSLRLQDFAGSRVMALLDESVSWQGALAATIDAYWTPGREPRLKVDVNAGSGSFELPQNGDKITADYQVLRLFATLDEGLAEGRFQLLSEQLGQGEIDLQLSLGEKERPVRGRIELAALQLKLLQPLIAPLEDIAGSVDAAATIGGTLNQPLLQGTVSLTDGSLKGASLPTSLEKIAVQAKFNNAQANISGELLLGKELAQLEGVIDWQQLPATGWLTLKGVRNRFHIEPGMTLLLSPDLRLDYKPELLEISGTVSVPYGRIKIKELPKGAVNRSADVVIIDAPTSSKKQQVLPLALALKVTLLDDVKIDALGLKADLTGALAIKQTPKQPLSGNGRIELNNGSYRAFGQNLQVNKGLLLFSGPIGEPYIDADAIRNPDVTSDNVIAGVRLRGEAKRPKVTIYSEPAMAQQEALSYLLRGRSLASSSDTSQDTQVATALLSAGIGSSEGLISNLGKAFGVKELAVDTRGEGTDTKVAVTGYVLPGVQVGYGVGVFTPVTEITLRYEIVPKLMLEAISGLRAAVDLLYEFEF